MAISLGDNFDHQGDRFNFKRDSFATLEEMKQYPISSVPDGFETFCVLDKSKYRMDKSIEADEITGNWVKEYNAKTINNTLLFLSSITTFKEVSNLEFILIKNSGNIEPLLWYKILDYQPTLLPSAANIRCSGTIPIIFLAIDKDTLALNAYSPEYPQCILEVVLNSDIYKVDNENNSLVVVGRRDIANNVYAKEDWGKMQYAFYKIDRTQIPQYDDTQAYSAGSMFIINNKVCAASKTKTAEERWLYTLSSSNDKDNQEQIRKEMLYILQINFDANMLFCEYVPLQLLRSDSDWHIGTALPIYPPLDKDNPQWLGLFLSDYFIGIHVESEGYSESCLMCPDIQYVLINSLLRSIIDSRTRLRDLFITSMWYASINCYDISMCKFTYFGTCAILTYHVKHNNISRVSYVICVHPLDAGSYFSYNTGSIIDNSCLGLVFLKPVLSNWFMDMTFTLIATSKIAAMQSSQILYIRQSTLKTDVEGLYSNYMRYFTCGIPNLSGNIYSLEYVRFPSSTTNNTLANIFLPYYKGFNLTTRANYEQNYLIFCTDNPDPNDPEYATVGKFNRRNINFLNNTHPNNSNNCYLYVDEIDGSRSILEIPYTKI